MSLLCVSESCVDGTFGMNCTQTCHCATEAMCDQITGRCERGRCEQGYTGDNCQGKIQVYNNFKLQTWLLLTINVELDIAFIVFLFLKGTWSNSSGLLDQLIIGVLKDCDGAFHFEVKC